MIHTTPPQNFQSKFEVVSCFLIHDGEILLLHRQDHKPQGNTWGIPAGKVDEGEDIEMAIRREIEQETGIIVSTIDYDREVYVQYIDDGYDFVYHMFFVELDGERPDVVLHDDEHKACTWATPEQALQMPLIQDEDACIKLFFNV